MIELKPRLTAFYIIVVLFFSFWAKINLIQDDFVSMTDGATTIVDAK